LLDTSATLEAFLSATAAKQPTPGGGAVAALSGSLAASLAEMVIQYSLGKPALAAYQVELQTVLGELTRARHLMSGLISEDQSAYEALVAGRKLAAGTPRRDEIIAAAMQACLTAPQTVAATGVAILELCEQVVAKVNKHLLSDLAIAADLATATVRIAIYNVKINLADLDDALHREAIEHTNQQILSRTLNIIQRLSPEIWRLHGAKG